MSESEGEHLRQRDLILHEHRPLLSRPQFMRRIPLENNNYRHRNVMGEHACPSSKYRKEQEE